MLVFAVFDLALSFDGTVVGASVIILMNLSIPFPFLVAAEHKGCLG